MSYVKGSTTWTALSQKLTQLVCGEVADDFGTTVASGDRWVREQSRTVTDGVLNSTTTLTSATASFAASDVGSEVIGTGIPAGAVISSVTNSTTVVMSVAAIASASGVTVFIALGAIKTPSSQDLALGNMSNRSGYFSLTGWPYVTNAVMNGLAYGAVGYNSVCKVNAPFTSDPSTSGFHRWIVYIVCQTANTTASDYSTARFQVIIYDADSASQLLNASSQAVSSAGVWTTSTSGFKFAVSASDGIIRVGTTWVRGFTASYMYGIDRWTMLPRRSTTPTFSVNPSGSSGTDYDIVEQCNAVVGNTLTTNLTSVRSEYFYGLGIKTATGNSGALYTVSWSVSLMKARIFQTGSAQVGVLGLDFGGRSIVDTVNGNAVRQPKFRTLTWARCFQTAGSVLGSSPVQYWMSVTATGVALVLFGDPGATGKMGSAWFGTFTPSDSTYDVLPTSMTLGMADYTSNTAGAANQIHSEYGHSGLVRRQDGSENRDWQTAWMRTDGEIALTGSSSAYWTGAGSFDSSSIAFGALTNLAGNPLYCGNIPTDIISSNFSAAPARQIKPATDGKWWMYAPIYMDFEANNASATVDEYQFVRGYQNARYLFIPESGWASGDELTDSVSGVKYLLITPDYPTMMGRMRTSTSSYAGGMAMAEV